MRVWNARDGHAGTLGLLPVHAGLLPDSVSLGALRADARAGGGGGGDAARAARVPDGGRHIPSGGSGAAMAAGVWCARARLVALDGASARAERLCTEAVARRADLDISGGHSAAGREGEQAAGRDVGARWRPCTRPPEVQTLNSNPQP